MRKIFLLLALLISGIAFGQTNTDSVFLYKGSASTYFTVRCKCLGTLTPVDFPTAGYLSTQYNFVSDSTAALLYSNTRKYVIQPTKRVKFFFGDSTNKQVPSITALRTWFRTYIGN